MYGWFSSFIAGRFRSKYAHPIYNLAVDYINVKSKRVSLMDLYGIFGIKNEPMPFSVIEQRMLKPGIAQINKHSEIDIRYESSKDGTDRMQSVIFYFDRKKDFDFSEVAKKQEQIMSSTDTGDEQSDSAHDAAMYMHDMTEEEIMEMRKAFVEDMNDIVKKQYDKY